MAKEKTTAEERKRFILERTADEEANKGKKTQFPRDRSFINWKGNIVHPNKQDYKAHRKISEWERDYQSRPRYIPLIVLGISLSIGIFFLAPNLTGNVIGNLTTANVIGVTFIICGLIAAYFWKKK